MSGAPWSDAANDADVIVRAAPTMGLIHELFTLAQSIQMVTNRLLEAQAEVEANLAELRAQGRTAEVAMLERALEAMDLVLPIVRES